MSIGYLKNESDMVNLKARLTEKIILSHKDGEVILDGRTSLTFLNKNSHGKYVFCVKKLHGTGQSAIILDKNEFIWIDKNI